MDTFDQLPVSAIVNGMYLCVHGGISSFVTSVEAINEIDRKSEPPDEDCLFSDLLWADPASNQDFELADYTFNDKRFASVIFGKRPVNALLEKEGLKCIVRSHECKMKGYKEHRWNGK